MDLNSQLWLKPTTKTCEQIQKISPNASSYGKKHLSTEEKLLEFLSSFEFKLNWIKHMQDLFISIIIIF